MNAEALWSTIQHEARAERELTPQLAGYLDSTVLQHSSLGAALAYQLSVQLTKYDSALTSFRPQFEAMIDKYQIEEAASADLFKVASSNPACPNALSAFLSFRGFQSFQLHRIAHRYWHEGNTTLAVLLQNWGAQIYNVDIHPAAKVGKGLFVDHAMGIVVGETAVIEDDVSIWHGVTLGSTFSESGDRHPKIRRGATLAVGAIILGNIEIGEGAVIAAGSVVLQSIPPGMVAAGVPAKVIKSAAAAYAAITTQKR